MQIKTSHNGRNFAYDRGEPGVNTDEDDSVVWRLVMAQGLPLSSPPPNVGEFLTPVLCVLSASGPVLVLQSPNPGVTV